MVCLLLAFTLQLSAERTYLPKEQACEIVTRLTLSSLGGGVGTTGTALLLDVVALPPAPDAQRVRLILSLPETRGSLRLRDTEHVKIITSSLSPHHTGGY